MRKRQFKPLVCVTGLFVVTWSILVSAAPNTVQVQGYLLNNEGDADGGTYTMTLTLADVNEIERTQPIQLTVTPDAESGFFQATVPVDAEFVRIIQPVSTGIKLVLSKDGGSEEQNAELDQVVMSVPYALNAGQAVRAPDDLTVSEKLVATSGTTTVMGNLVIEDLVVDTAWHQAVKCESVELLEISSAGDEPGVFAAKQVLLQDDLLVQGDASVMSFERLVETPEQTNAITIFPKYADGLILLLHPDEEAQTYSNAFMAIENRYSGVRQFIVTPNLPNGGYFIPITYDQKATWYSGETAPKTLYLRHFQDGYFIHLNPDPDSE